MRQFLLTPENIEVCCPPREKTRLFGLARQISEATTTTQQRPITPPTPPRVLPAAAGPMPAARMQTQANTVSRQAATPTVSHTNATTTQQSQTTQQTPSRVPTAYRTPTQATTALTPALTNMTTTQQNHTIPQTPSRVPTAAHTPTQATTTRSTMFTCAAGYRNRATQIGCGGFPPKTAQYFDTYGPNTKKAKQFQASCRTCRFKGGRTSNSSSIPPPASPTSPDHNPNPKKKPRRCGTPPQASNITSLNMTQMLTPTNMSAPHALNSTPTIPIPWHLRVLANANQTTTPQSPSTIANMSNVIASLQRKFQSP